MKQKSQAGFAHIGLILLIVMVLGAVGGSGYYVYHKNHEKKQGITQPQHNSTPKQQTAPIATYDECMKVTDSIQQETYPPTCETKDGKRFTQTSQAFTYKVPELNIEIVNVPASMQGLTDYRNGSSNGFVSAEFSTRTLTQIDSQCSATNNGIGQLASMPGEYDSAKNGHEDNTIFLKQFSGFWLAYSHPESESCSYPSNVATSLFTTQTADFQKLVTNPANIQSLQ